MYTIDLRHKRKCLFLLLVLVFCFTFLFTSCNKADDYYQELYDKPEIMEFGYRTTYEVGDTFAIYGRLQLDKGLTLRIGEIDADLVYQGYDEVKKAEVVKTIISREMGAGNNRSVRLIAGKAYLDAPSINIYSSENAGYLQDSLELISYATLPSNIVLVRCLSENGNVYYWHNSEKKLYKVLPDGTKAVSMGTEKLVDEQGTFDISSFYSGAVDPKENYFYFSVLTTDKSADNTRNFIYRLCRFDIKNGEFLTLNRTLVRKGAVPAILTTEPLEGNIKEAQLLGVGQIFPDSIGNVYLQPRIMTTSDGVNSCYATALLTQTESELKLEYLLKSRSIGQGAGGDAALTSIPGISINDLQGIVMPDDGLMFTNPQGKTNTITGYDMNLKTQIYTLVTQRPSDTSTPVIYGEFSGLFGDTETMSAQIPARFGFMPFRDGRLLVLYYQFAQGFAWTNFPLIGVLDFPNQRGDKYSVGRLETNSFQMRREGDSFSMPYIYADKSKDDKMLNYDEQGMIYMSANNHTVLVKTKIKN